MADKAKLSRRCHACNIYWPIVSGVFSCPLCGTGTQADEDEPDFASPALAEAWVINEQHRRAKQAVFDDFDWLIDSNRLERDLADMLLVNEADLAAQFAKLERLPIKEVTSDR